MARRIGILGGSSAFMPVLAGALARHAADLPPLTVTLHGRNTDRLVAVARFCNLHAASLGIDHAYEITTSVAAAAEGAAVVVNQMRIGGWAGRVHDDQFPLAFDLPGDETIGPAGLASAIRSMPFVVDAARQVRAAAPDAWFVNLTNPMSILLDGLRRTVPELRTFGICELPRETLHRALALIGRDPVGVEADYFGVNHQGWFVRIADGERDLLPDIIEAVAALPADNFFAIDADVMRALHALPLHYLRLFYHRRRVVRVMRDREAPRGSVLDALSTELYRHYAATPLGTMPGALEQRNMPWCDDLAGLITGLLGGRAARVFVSAVNDGDVPGLPADAIVERLATIDVGGSRAVPLADTVSTTGPALAPFRTFLRRVVEFEAAAATVALQPDHDAVIEALRLHPFDIIEADLSPLATAVLKPVEGEASGRFSGGKHGHEL